MAAPSAFSAAGSMVCAAARPGGRGGGHDVDGERRGRPPRDEVAERAEATGVARVAERAGIRYRRRRRCRVSWWSASQRRSTRPGGRRAGAHRAIDALAWAEQRRGQRHHARVGEHGSGPGRRR